MARVKGNKRRAPGPKIPQPIRVQWVPAEADQETDHTNNMSDKRQGNKRPATEIDISAPDPKSARTSAFSPALDGSVAGSADSQPHAPAAKTHCHFMQIYIQDVPWDPDGEKEAWMHMEMEHCLVRLDLESGINFFFSEDHYKIIPYGRIEPCVYDHNMCGFTLAPGYCMKWQYDHMFHYHHNNIKRAFMVVKMSLCKPNPPLFTKESSSIIDGLMRTRFKCAGPPALTMPCWFPSSQVERERDHYKALYNGKKQALDQSIENYLELDTRTTLLENNLDKSEAKVRRLSSALEDIDQALQCAICLERFAPTGHCKMASCGHVIHTHCHAKKNDTCATCRAPVRYWQDFHGFTAISEAITKVHAELDCVK